MAASKAKKKSYRVTNWRECNESLVRRGDITFGWVLAKLIGVVVAIPHHTSLVKRAAKLDVNTQLADVKGPIDVVVDSTGLEVYGEGEWHVRRHGVGERRD